jgi:hypothetical protein
MKATANKRNWRGFNLWRGWRTTVPCQQVCCSAFLTCQGNVHAEYCRTCRYPQRTDSSTKQVVIKCSGAISIVGTLRKPLCALTGGLVVKARVTSSYMNPLASEVWLINHLFVTWLLNYMKLHFYLLCGIGAYRCLSFNGIYKHPIVVVSIGQLCINSLNWCLCAQIPLIHP